MVTAAFKSQAISSPDSRVLSLLLTGSYLVRFVGLGSNYLTTAYVRARKVTCKVDNKLHQHDSNDQYKCQF
jgi:hypothetical protein